MLSQLRISILMLTVLTLLTGIVYPCLVTAVAQLAFPHQANGSLIEVHGKPVGSELIGQEFQNPAYFWGRPSATAQHPFNATASGGSNLGPLNPALHEAVQARINAFHTFDSDREPVPIDLVTSSASGLDPHISLAAAEYQIARAARYRGMRVERVWSAIRENVEYRTMGILGEPRVNVLRVNLALDRSLGTPSKRGDAKME